jgi:enoyl-CoA hydratase/carnithine racemase
VASDVVLTEQVGRTLLITLNRPEVMNAINEALVEGLLTAVRRLDEDPGLTVGVLTGAGGRAFSAGMDLKAFSRGEDMRGAIATLVREAAAELGPEILLRAAHRAPQSALNIGMAENDAAIRPLSAKAQAEADKEKRKEGVKESAGKERARRVVE